MKPSSPLPVGFWLALAVGLLLRAWYFSDLVAQPWFGYPLVDALTFDNGALALLRGEPQGVFFRPPLYTHVLAVIYRFAGHSPAAVVWVQFVLGLVTLVPAYLLGERWFGRRAALVGVWIAACYPLRIFFEGETLDVTVFGFLFILATWQLWQALEGRSVSRVFIAGLVFGVAALARPNVLVALPCIACGAALALRVGWRRLPALGVSGALGVALAVAPATVHNWRAEGAFVPVAANGGANFFLGNEQGATGLTPVPPGLRWEQVMLRPIRLGFASVSAQDRWWYAQAAAEIREAPGRWLVLLAKKTAIFAGAAEPSNNKALSPFTAVSVPVRHYHGWFGALLCLALVGVVARPGSGSVFLGWVVAGFVASVALFFVAERYRLPLVPLLALAAGAGVERMLVLLRSRDLWRTFGLAALLASAALCVFPDWFGAGIERVNTDMLMGQVYLMRNEPAQALAAMERARADHPEDPDVWNILGAARFDLGDLDGAEAAYREALRLGEFGEVWFNLGVVSEKRGPAHREEAASRYLHAIEVNPADPRPRVNLSLLAAAAGGFAPGEPAR